METTLSLQQRRLAQSVLIFVVFLVTLLSVFVKNIFADAIQPSISNLTQEQVANTYRIAFDFDLQGLAAQPGDTFTITLPPELTTANMLAFDVTQNEWPCHWTSRS
ncbi:hypothetical protein SAG0136_02750 [Streptococcus agalactiae LMG 14747]|uniref:SDR-like Ig domain-containing protein n=1 Tax=Streptococcus agalactiae LMG 14747 TaxID=1154860 RepID=V6Z0A1_STRAG|nr:hypothetical protein SAG0136_02750 [Streptococcus agalactiae LMG 14747]